MEAFFEPTFKENPFRVPLTKRHQLLNLYEAFTKSFGKSTIVTFKNVSGKEFVQIIVVQNTTHHNYCEIISIKLKRLQPNSFTTAENLRLKTLRLLVSNFVTLIRSWSYVVDRDLVRHKQTNFDMIKQTQNLST